MVIAGMMYAAGGIAQAVPTGATDAETGMTVLESMIFGSLVSATDPVTVLAVFGKMGADRDLYAIVFGESVLNDAVAIVLYKTFSTFNPHNCERYDCLDKESSVMANVAGAVGTFCYIFLGSLFVGCLIAAASSLVFKHTALYDEEFFVTENVLLLIFPYMAWMLAESIELSGIVAILFCGFGMSHYTTLSLSDHTKASTQSFFRVMAFGCETFVFIYMGLAMFTYHTFDPYPEGGGDYQFVGAVLVSILAMLLSRLINVFPLCYLVNLRRPARRKISEKVQFVVWFSGLRGGIAFALSLQARAEFLCRRPTCWVPHDDMHGCIDKNCELSCDAFGKLNGTDLGFSGKTECIKYEKLWTPEVEDYTKEKCADLGYDKSQTSCWEVRPCVTEGVVKQCVCFRHILCL
jgi:NhaP-type Na+/H+ or K+/H+ antiporter